MCPTTNQTADCAGGGRRSTALNSRSRHSTPEYASVNAIIAKNSTQNPTPNATRDDRGVADASRAAWNVRSRYGLSANPSTHTGTSAASDIASAPGGRASDATTLTPASLRNRPAQISE